METYQSSSQVETDLKLLRIGQLFKKTAQVFRERIYVFISIMVIPILISIVLIILFVFGFSLFNMLFSLSGGSWFMYILGFFLALSVVIIVFLWPTLAILYAVKEREIKIGAKDALKKAWSKIVSLYWVMLLSNIIISVGFLLLIIPGIIFCVWFSLASSVLVAENLKGAKALRRSKELVGKNWWPVFFRLASITIISSAISFLINTTLFDKTPYGEIFGYILIILWSIFSLIYFFLLYENLKELKGKEIKKDISQQSYV